MLNKIICALLFCIALTSTTFAQHRPIPAPTLLLITKAEDERRWDDDLRKLFSSPNASIRSRAALAAGRIGNEDSLSALVDLLEKDREVFVRAMAAFAIGEVESEKGANALVAVLKNTKSPVDVKSRAVEALGKIAAALPREQEARRLELGAVILETLKAAPAIRSSADYSLVLFGLTAALRARPTNAGPTIARFLDFPNPRAREDASNALARLRLKDANPQLRKLLASDTDVIVRANAARILGITEDKESYDALLKHSMTDEDTRVRVSAIRALAALKDPRAAQPLLKRGQELAQKDVGLRPAELNEILEIATTLGRLLAQKEDQAAVAWLRKMSVALNHNAPEIEIALLRIAPATYLAGFGSGDEARKKVQETILLNWNAASGVAAGLGEVAALPNSVPNKSELAATAQTLLRAMLDYRNSGLTINTLVAVHSEYAIPDVLRALAAFKPADLGTVAQAQLKESDVIVRGTAADLLGDLPPSEEITHALAAAWPQTANDSLNDAALSILDSLGKQKSSAANEVLKEALKSDDLLIRRRAATLLKANGAGDFSSQIGTVKSRNTDADYKRALARIGKSVQAVVTTSKGSFTIDLLPDAAPLTVDNFVQLAQRDYYRNVTIHRVVPNFVIQDGDPRGDGNGGPGYQIRCEINQLLYERAAVGMALSGKDTGGSQWFVTHSPQPHLDGGYTVFGRVVTGMGVVDQIVRGDVIQSITIKQGPRKRG
ncbi:MAG TPA: peptidylprolyl isomerase [Pyrinomonadaceae bacterium]|nr:peptidylprolyl isomerase [Pyrinomonadaceae bacterium]